MHIMPGLAVAELKGLKAADEPHLGAAAGADERGARKVKVNGPKVLELDVEEDDEAATASAAAAAGGGEDGARAQNLNRMVSLLNQRKLETCLNFRSFVARDLVSRARLLKAVHARLDLWRACSPG